MILSHTLVLEDDAVSAFITEKTLKKYNPEMEVVTIKNGSLAIEYLKTNPLPQLVIFDLHMPVMDGFEFLKRIHDENIDICNNCICAISNVIRSEERDRLKAMKCTDFIEKPFSPEKLTDVLLKCFPHEKIELL